MSTSTSTPSGATLPESGHEGPSNGENATSTTIPPSTPSHRGQVKVSAPIATRKRKARNQDATEIENENSNQVGSSSSTKRPRVTSPEVQTPAESSALSSETPIQGQVSVQERDVSRSTGKRKQRDEEETSSDEKSSTSQTAVAHTSTDQTSITSTLPDTEEDRPTKKQRLDTDEPAQDETESAIVETEPKLSPLLTLPLELLAEILIRTASPQHVLATARSCKALCETLLSHDAAFIWREARKRCCFGLLTGEGDKNVELPDLPAQFFSEPAYAAFLFDSGPCDNCQNETSMMYRSFGLRLRLCDRTICRWSSKISPFDPLIGSSDHVIYAVLPTNEAEPEVLANNAASGPFWPHVTSFCRTEDRDREISNYRSASEEFDKKLALRAKRKIEWMAFCVQLLKWKKAREACYTRTALANTNLSKQFASKYGWNYEMLMITIYGSYVRNKTKLIEEINEVDVKVMKNEIEARLLSLDDKRTRRNNEIILMNNRSEVEKTYDKLHSGKDYPYMPSLHTFRTLSVVSMLQSSVSSDLGSIYDTFKKDKRMKELLSNQLKAWTAQAKSDLGAVLGLPKNWKNASVKVLHPAERVTARYLCTKCERLDVKYRADGCLDFTGACLHECAVGSGKKASRLRKGKKAIWDSKNFVKDEKAVKVLKSAVEAFGFAEDLDEGNKLLKSGLAIVCTSCSPSMVLDSLTIIGHSHRHDDMQMSFNTSTKGIISSMGGYPYEHGLVQKLLRPSSFTKAGKAEIDRKNYGCRHCLREKQIQDPVAAAAATASALEVQDSVDEETEHVAPEPEKPASVNRVDLSLCVYRLHTRGISGPTIAPPPLFNFNGMRSHMKGKHGIEDIRDEDILCYRPPDV